MILAEAALALGRTPQARAALDDALGALQRSGDRRAARRAESLMSRA